MSTIVIDKPIGWTPLQIIQKYRQLYPEFSKVKISYAGRLDPLAHGVLLLLAGEERREREAYLALPKTYEFEMLFGIASDTYDLLGYTTHVHKNQIDLNVKIFVKLFVNSHIGKQLQAYPPYSSRTVKGKPLFWWAKNKKLHEIQIPQKEIEIFDFACLEMGQITPKALQKRVDHAISSVEGEFRQKEIAKRWEEVFSDKNIQNKNFVIAKCRIVCSSGTYIREIVNQMGKEFGCGAVAMDILRTKVGNFTLKDALHFSKS